MVNSHGDVYLGQWRGNKREGRGTQLTFKSDGSLWYLHEGYFIDGNKQGTAREISFEGRYYIGSYSDNVRSGQGQEFFPDGRKYEGEWKNDKKNG